MREFSMKDKIGYMFGDLGGSSMELFRGAYLSVFYTLVLKINPLHLGVLFLITKLWDGINDPIIGMIVDSHHPKKGGKFKPWIKIFTIPAAVLFVLGFLNISNLDYGLKLAYCFVSYILYEGMFTAVSVPYGSMSSVMTEDDKERTDLSRFRSLGGTIFMTFIVIAGPMILFVDNQPVPGRFALLASFLALVSIFSFFICYRFCLERVDVSKTRVEKINYMKTVKDISKNKALTGMMFSSLIGIAAASVVNGLNIYLFRDYFGDVKMMAISGMLSILYTALIFVGTKYIAEKIGKKEWCIRGTLVSVGIFAILFFFPVKNPMIFIGLFGLSYIFASGFQVLVWAMVNDAIDYHELQTGERKEATIYSTYSLFRKLANAISASAVSFTLAIIGFDVEATTQTSAVLSNLWHAYTGVFVIGYLAAVIVMFRIYPLNKQKTEEMKVKLKEMRSAKKKVLEVIND